MRTVVLALGTLILSGATSATAGEAGGVRWAEGPEAGLARAAREGRPVLVAVNALETERANQALALEHYPSEAWGHATEDWVCLVGNPNDHPVEGGLCGRYGAGLCADHQATLSWILRRFSSDGTLISPQHLILDPDGTLVFRKEYFTGVVGPDLFESWLPRLAPFRAVERAARLRRPRLDALEATSTTDLLEAARVWAGSGDPLAPAGLVAAIDECLDPRRKVVLAGALAAAPPDALPPLAARALEATLVPDAEPEVALALATALHAADPEAGGRALARVAIRTDAEDVRRRALAVWGEGGEEPARLEVGFLLGRLAGEPPSGLSEAWARRLLRARAVGKGQRPRLGPRLPETAADAPAGRLREALLEATPEEVRAHAELVRAVLRDRPEERVRVAAALALLGARLDAPGSLAGASVASVVRDAVFDPVEGPEARDAAVRRLGADPGWNQATWLEALAAALEAR